LAPEGLPHFGGMSRPDASPSWRSSTSRQTAPLLAAPPQQARPAEESHADLLDLVEAELAQLDDIEQRTQLRPDLLLADDRRPRLVRLAGVAGQHPPARLVAGQS